MKKTFLILLIIISAAFAVRGLVSIKGLSSPERYLKYPDSGSYINPARALLKTGKFTASPESVEPYAVRTPGYPLFLAAVFAFSENNTVFHIIIFIFVSSLTCIPVYLTAKLFLNEIAGLIAAGLFAFNITSIANAPLYLTDTLFVFFIAWKLYFFTKFCFQKKITDIAFSAVFYGIATQVRPMSLFWLAPAVFLIAILSGVSIKKKVVCALIMLSGYAVFIMPWMYRNYRNNVGFYLDENISYSLYIFNAPLFESLLTGEPSDEIRERWRFEAAREFASNPEKYSITRNRLEYMNNAGKKLILNHPVRYILLTLRPYVLLPDVPTFFEILGLTQTGRNTQDVLNRLGFIAAVKNYFNGKYHIIIYLIPLLAVYTLMFLCAFGQSVKWCISKNFFWVWYFLAFVIYFQVVPGLTTPPRYNLPMTPFAAVAASIFIYSIFNLKKKLR